MRAWWRGAALLLALAALGGCSIPKSRPTPRARIGGRLDRLARRADALGLTPTASSSRLSPIWRLRVQSCASKYKTSSGMRS